MLKFELFIRVILKSIIVISLGFLLMIVNPFEGFGQGSSKKVEQPKSVLRPYSFSIKLTPTALLGIYTPMYQVGIEHSFTKYWKATYEFGYNAAFFPSIFKKLNQNREAVRAKMGIRHFSKKMTKWHNYATYQFYYKRSQFDDESSFLISTGVNKIFNYTVVTQSIGLTYGQGRKISIFKHGSIELEWQIGAGLVHKRHDKLDSQALEPYNKNFLTKPGYLVLPTGALIGRFCFDF